jgi:4-hydroxy-tetrahydrodipicolinate synthase
MCTPFTHGDQRLDEGRLYEHIDYLIDAGVHGIVMNSGTGEFAYMDDAEALAIAAKGAAHIGGKIPVIVQTSTVSLKLCIENSKAAIDGGADSLMVLPPWLVGPFAPGLIYHYLSLADAVDTTLVLYNIPQVSGVEVTPNMWAELSAHPNIGYIKDSTGDLAKMQNLLAADSQEVSGVMGGCDPIAPFALLAGACGWIWGAANVMPRECVALYELIRAGNVVDAMELWSTKMLPLNSYIWDNPHDAEYITAVKTATALRTTDLGPSRLPQLPLNDHAQAAIRKAVEALSVTRMGASYENFDD